jgi:2-polyprenyl-3-methyl-5-hydroxy-6-metoxy-1,4-benzoquinol methylase
MSARAGCNACGSMQHEAFFEKEGWQLLRCARCQLVFVGNPPTDEQREALYSFASGYHEELGKDAASIAFHRREAERNLAVLTRHRAPGGRLLDIGCSSGLFLDLARKVGWQVRGLEYSPDSAQMARDQFKLDVVTGELRPDTFAPGSFDVVTLWDVIEHVPDPKSVLQRVKPLLAPGGLLVLKTPNVDGLYPQLSLRLAQGLGFWGHPEPPGHLFQFSVATLTQMVRGMDYTVKAVHQQRIPISYSFGSPRGWFRSAKWLGYCLTFAPLATVGPWIGRGDDFVLVCGKA